MEAILFIPYAAGDPVNGFQYEGRDFTEHQYVQMVMDDYMKYKDMVFGMVANRYGKNMSINPFTKVKRAYKPVSWSYDDCNCEVKDLDMNEETESNIQLMASRNESTVLVMTIRNIIGVPDVETEMKMWAKQTIQMDRSPKLTDEEKIMNYPRKDLRLQFRNGNMVTLEKCQVYDWNGGSVYTIYVNSMSFTKKSKK